MLGTELLVGPRVRQSRDPRRCGCVPSVSRDANSCSCSTPTPPCPNGEEIERMFDESRRDSHAVMFASAPNPTAN
jgi:hypothetical protein